MSKSEHPRRILERAGLRPKASFGQNFLIDPTITDYIADQIVGGESTAGVIEIGAGLGALTGRLLEREATALAIERDRDLIPILQHQFSEALASGRLQILETDAKTADYVQLFHNLPRPHVLSGNLPYQITGPLLRQCCAISRDIARAVFMVQREVAERLVAAPDTDAYGALSVFAQALFRVQCPRRVPAAAFYPRPEVESAVVVLHPLEVPIAEETPAFRALVQGAFGQRRKTLKNAWRGVFGGALDELQATAERVGIDLGKRGETLSVADFAGMARAMSPVAKVAKES